MPAPALSFVLPVYDEARVIGDTLPALLEAGEGLGRAFEIVCVDDGSTDDSPRLLAEAAGRDERVRVFTLPENRGKGAAVRRGMMEARGDVCVFLDADLSTPLDEVPRLLEAIDAGADVVLGSRRVPGARITRRQPWLRETLGKGFSLSARLLLDPEVRDFTCGFKAFRGDAAREVFSASTLDGWAFDAELVVIARARGLAIAQVPVTWRHEDDTKVRLGAAVAGSGLEVLRIFTRRITGAYRR
jgi:dolichyl-phosphate beta-glucosyltransferase